MPKTRFSCFLLLFRNLVGDQIKFKPGKNGARSTVLWARRGKEQISDRLPSAAEVTSFVLRREKLVAERPD